MQNSFTFAEALVTWKVKMFITSMNDDRIANDGCLPFYDYNLHARFCPRRSLTALDDKKLSPSVSALEEKFNITII